MVDDLCAIRKYQNSFVHDEYRVLVSSYIERHVRISSEAMARGSLRLTHHVLDYYHNHRGTHIPPLKNGVHCTTLTRKAFTPHPRDGFYPLPIETVDNVDGLLPPINNGIDLPDGMSGLFKNLASKYATNAQNHFIMNWSRFLDRTIFAYMQTQGVPNKSHPLFRPLYRELRRAITQPSYNSPHLNQYDTRFVGYHHSIFIDYGIISDNAIDDESSGNESSGNESSGDDSHGNRFSQGSYANFCDDDEDPEDDGPQPSLDRIDNVLDEDWVGDHIGIMPILFAHWMSYIEHVEDNDPRVIVKKFHILPIHELTRQSIPFQGYDLYYLVKDVLFNGGQVFNLDQNGTPTGTRLNKDQFQKHRKKFWELLFTVSENEHGGREHNDKEGIVTNGVYASMSFKKPPPPEEEDEGEGDGDPRPPRPPAKVSDLRPSNITINGQDYTLERETVAVDPGRVCIIHAVKYNRSGEVIKRIRLTRKQYYTEAGLYESTAKANTREARMKDYNSAKSIHHFKTSRIGRFRDAINVLTEYYGDIIRHKIIDKFWKRQELRREGKKKSVIQRTLNNFLDGNQTFDELNVAWGDGDFAATAKNELSVPTKYVKRIAEASYQYCYATNEYMTSSACLDCQGQLFKVYMLRAGRVFEVRGLKWCNSYQCRDCCMKHREDVGSGNILISYICEKLVLDRPPLLDRHHAIQTTKIPTKPLRNQYALKSPHTNVPKSLKKKLIKQKRQKKRQRKHERRRIANQQALAMNVDSDSD